jgi:hypothetical protein
VTWLAWAGEEHLREGIDQERAAAIAVWARLRMAGQDCTPADWLRADQRWTGAALARVHEDRLELLAVAGEHRLRADDIPPRLVEAVKGTSVWRPAPGRLAAAAAIRGEGAAPIFAYAEARVDEPEWIWLAWVWAGALATGGILGWYLMRHVWRPWSDTQAALEAALADRPLPRALASSEETAAVQSSLIQLIERSRSGSEGHPTRHGP